MCRLVILLVLVISIIGKNVAYDIYNPEPLLGTRIVGGDDASITEVPYQILILSRGKVYCGGSIISKNLVLTAAHCFPYTIQKHMKVRAGSTKAHRGGSIHRIVWVYTHENYKESSYNVPINDIAIIKVDPQFQFDDSRQPIPLIDVGIDTKPTSWGTVSGWGSLKQGGAVSSTLKYVNLPIISKKKCNAIYQRIGGLPKGQICTAHPSETRDACQGDSGGPLVMYGFLAGIISWGEGCARLGIPGVYTEVAYYRNWIISTSNKANAV